MFFLIGGNSINLKNNVRTASSDGIRCLDLLCGGHNKRQRILIRRFRKWAKEKSPQEKPLRALVFSFISIRSTRANLLPDRMPRNQRESYPKQSGCSL
jgi:hypothetical protein